MSEAQPGLKARRSKRSTMSSHPYRSRPCLQLVGTATLALSAVILCRDSAGEQPASDDPGKPCIEMKLWREIDVSGYQGNLVLTVFGRYRAGIRVSYSGY